MFFQYQKLLNFGFAIKMTKRTKIKNNWDQNWTEVLLKSIKWWTNLSIRFSRAVTQRIQSAISQKHYAHCSRVMVCVCVWTQANSSNMQVNVASIKISETIERNERNDSKVFVAFHVSTSEFLWLKRREKNPLAMSGNSSTISLLFCFLVVLPFIQSNVTIEQRRSDCDDPKKYGRKIGAAGDLT